MPQFLIHPSQITGNKATLTGEEARHLVRVLRHKTGDKIFLSDGGHQYDAVIESAGAKEVVCRLLERRLLKAAAPSPVLGLALLKHDHLEMVLQKGVELGVGEFYLFVSERTIPHYRESAGPKKTARFEKIAREAAKQSGMISMPKIHPPLAWEEFVRHFKQFSGVMLAWEEERESTFHSVFEMLDPSRLLLLVGPEGGFTVQEVARAEKAGAKKISLGRQILRSETAAMALVTLCQYELGNI